MKSMLKLVLGAVAVFHLSAAASAIAQPEPAIQPARPVGFQQVRAEDPGHAPIVVDVWYPTDSAPGLIQAGPVAVQGTVNAPVAGNRLPMVVVSHGTGGGSMSHLDTVLALAEAGFVVAAPAHTGDNFRDDSTVGRPNWLVDRSRHIARVIDFMLGGWRDAAHLNGNRVGIFGFSAGATTALITIGGVPDLGRIASHCGQHPEFACNLIRAPADASGAAVPIWTHDARVVAAVIAAPGLGFTFAPAGLSSVRVPVQLWAGADDQTVPYDTNTGIVRRLLPREADFHRVARARHLSFLMPCGAINIPQLCEDAEGFDRAAFHREFNRAVTAFFRDRLGNPATASPSPTGH